MLNKEAPSQKPLRVTLHIGSTKTGSSALQKLLYANRKALAKASVYYPDIGIASNAHHVLLAAIHPGAWNLHKDAYDTTPIEYFQHGVSAILERAQETGCKHLVLSSEYMWGEFGPNVYKNLRDAFAGCRLRILACVRDPAHWAESTYLQALKRGEARGFSQWRKKVGAMPVRGFDFDAVVKKWSDGTGAASTTIVRYDFDNMDDFMHGMFDELTGVSLSDMPVSTIAGTENPSPTLDGMHEILDLNRRELPERERQKALNKIMKAHSRPPNTRELYFPKKH